MICGGLRDNLGLDAATCVTKRYILKRPPIAGTSNRVGQHRLAGSAAERHRLGTGVLGGAVEATRRFGQVPPLMYTRSPQSAAT